MNPGEDIIAVYLPGTSEPLIGWESVRMTDSFLDPIGSFELVYTKSPRRGAVWEKLQKGSLIGLHVNGNAVQLGLIQTTRTTFSRDGGVTVTLTGGTALATAYEAGIDPDLSLRTQSDVHIKEFVDVAMVPLGLELAMQDRHAADIGAMTGKSLSGAVKDLVPIQELKSKDAVAQANETAYRYIARIVTRLGVGMRCTYEGALMASTPHYDQPAAYMVATNGFAEWQGVIPDDVDLMTDAEITDTNQDQFTEINIIGEASSPPANAGPQLKRTLRPRYKMTQDEYAELKGMDVSRMYFTQWGQASGWTYVKTPEYKPLFITDKNARDEMHCRNLAALCFGLRTAKAYVVTGTVPSLVSKTGRVWTVDTICTVASAVFSEAKGYVDDMWLSERTLEVSRSGGQQAKLTLVPKGAIVLGDPESIGLSRTGKNPAALDKEQLGAEPEET